jgi:hypothetical protein
MGWFTEYIWPFPIHGGGYKLPLRVTKKFLPGALMPLAK